MLALVTGASSGIGLQYATKLERDYHTDLLLVSNQEEEQKKVAADLAAQYGVKTTALYADLSKQDAAEQLLQYCKDNNLVVDILINNAGVLDNGLKAIDSFTDEDMNRVIDINTKGTMCMMREVTEEMAKTGYGAIVNVASVAGVMGCGGAAYVASKAAVIGLTRHTALRFAGTNVRCNAICPGTIVTPMVAGMSPENMDMNIFGQMMKHNDLKVQPCMPEDVANMLLFFASDESRAITGQTIVTDFGSTL